MGLKKARNFTASIYYLTVESLGQQSMEKNSKDIF